MLLNVQELALRKEPVTLQETFDAVSAFAEVRDVKPAGPATAELTAYYADRTVAVAGKIDCTLHMLCSRCLDPIEEKLSVPFQETFKMVTKERGRTEEDELEVEDEEEDFVPLEGDRLELRPYVEAELVLHMPLAPLCSEDCKGLCPECGQNRNERDCACNAEKIDPRLASLKDWFDPKRQ